jgi:hypothetical protein
MILHVGGRTLRDDFGLHEEDFKIIPAGVTREQIDRYRLPSANFAKETSVNHNGLSDGTMGTMRSASWKPWSRRT